MHPCLVTDLHAQQRRAGRAAVRIILFGCMASAPRPGVAPFGDWCSAAHLKADGCKASTATSSSARGPSEAAWRAEAIVLLRMALKACRWALRTGDLHRSTSCSSPKADGVWGGLATLLHESVVHMAMRAPEVDRFYACVSYLMRNAVRWALRASIMWPVWLQVVVY